MLSKHTKRFLHHYQEGNVSQSPSEAVWMEEREPEIMKSLRAKPEHANTAGATHNGAATPCNRLAFAQTIKLRVTNIAAPRYTPKINQIYVYTNM